MFSKLLFKVFIGLLFLGSISHSIDAKDKIALLFLTRSLPNHPSLWKKLLKEASEQYSLYIHSKEPLDDPFFQKYRIANIVPTTWAIHAKAWQALIQEAFKDKENKYFVFLSEACIPLYRLDYIYSVITSDPRSHMAFAGPWWPPGNPRELHEFDSSYHYGNTEWMVLNRLHAEVVAKDCAIIRLAARHPQDQEAYFSTLFAIHNCLFNDLCCHSYTFVDWEHAINNGASPYHFEEISAFNDQLLKQAYGMGALFARKFTETYPWQAILEMITIHTSEVQKDVYKDH